MSESSFSILRDIGALPLGNGEEIRFSIDVYRGFRYVSIRRYVQTYGFSGPTMDGVTLTPEILRVLAPKIMGLADDSSTVPIGLLGKFAKRPGICIIAEICSQKGQRALALRQWEEEKGWTQKGIGLPLTQLKEIKQLFQQTREVLDEQPIDDF